MLVQGEPGIEWSKEYVPDVVYVVLFHEYSSHAVMLYVVSSCWEMERCIVSVLVHP